MCLWLFLLIYEDSVNQTIIYSLYIIPQYFKYNLCMKVLLEYIDLHSGCHESFHNRFNFYMFIFFAQTPFPLQDKAITDNHNQ